MTNPLEILGPKGPNTDLVPFGKYKGQPVEVLRADPDYCDWLTAQDWFRQRFQPLHTLIVNNFREPTETPEHNRLQAKFLDDEWARRFLTACVNGRVIRAVSAAQVENGIVGWRKDLTLLDEGRWYRDDPDPPRREDVVAELDALKRVDRTRVEWVSIETQFEVRGVDVVIGAFAISRGLKPPGDSPFTNWRRSSGYIEVDGESHRYETRCGAAICCRNVECKPALGDDYPAVLRQMKADDSDTLVIGEYVGEGATLEQVRRMFGQIAILTVAEIDASEIAP